MTSECEPLPVHDIVEDLLRLGVVAADTLMVHASMRSVGPVEDGAAGLVAALDAAVGAEGTLLMMVGVRDDDAWVNERPEAPRAALLIDATPFDHLVATADPECGVLAEVFRTMPGTVSSDHPEGRFSARGRDASAWVADVPWDDYYGPGSPLDRLVRCGGKVLRLGADRDTVTLIHFSEYLADVPHKRRVRRHRLVLTPAGPVVRTVTCLDDADGIVEHPGEDYFAQILDAYLEQGHGLRDVIGRAPSELLDAAHLVHFARVWMTANLGP